MKSKPQRAQRYRRVSKEKTLFPLRSLCALCGNVLAFVLFFSSASYSQSNKFGGIGVSVDIDSSVMQPYIVDILSGKPGAMAGLRSGDHILSINHWKTKGKSQEQVANKLRGRIGSQVDMDIDRGGKEMDFMMKRERIVVNEKSSNLCETLDIILKSISDSFYDIQGEMVNKPNKFQTIYKAKIQLPGFDSSKIWREYHGAFYSTYYFIGKDSVQAMNQCMKLISNIKDCLPYTIVSKFNEADMLNQGSRFWHYFTITGVKNKRYDKIKYWEINITRDCEPDKSFSVQIWIEHPRRID